MKKKGHLQWKFTQLLHKVGIVALANKVNRGNKNISFFRWNCIGWPNKIEQAIETTVKNLENDEDRFHKNLLDEQNSFQDRLDGLSMVVAGFSGYNDIHK